MRARSGLAPALRRRLPSWLLGSLSDCLRDFGRGTHRAVDVADATAITRNVHLHAGGTQLVGEREVTGRAHCDDHVIACDRTDLVTPVHIADRVFTDAEIARAAD